MVWRVEPPKPDGNTRVLGVDLGVRPIWWDSTPKYWKAGTDRSSLPIGGTIVLKIPGSTQWSARGQTKYYGAYFQVLEIERIDDLGNYVCRSIIDFPMRKEK